ncbi:hypothetical protein EYF80_047687 [Liparis tanakae]|uniref:Uncharacterized protein n=1 Tax=Liparis tanakae TaxID=230148 RepID=A0A4Z2FMX4_9TELE|nr:hypothetical protein EYF80_047687 [Liparis tanakae]
MLQLFHLFISGTCAPCTCFSNSEEEVAQTHLRGLDGPVLDPSRLLRWISKKKTNSRYEASYCSIAAAPGRPGNASSVVSAAKVQAGSGESRNAIGLGGICESLSLPPGRTSENTALEENPFSGVHESGASSDRPQLRRK